MQNKYVGDVGDFGKYGLLRWLTGVTRRATEEERQLWCVQVLADEVPAAAPKLGVVWYMNHDSGQGGGRFAPGDLMECDPILHHTLRMLVRDNNRNVLAVENGSILPRSTQYFRSCRCHFSNRPAWLSCALANTCKADLVFLDPDNGITFDAYTDNDDSPKHTYLSDIRQFFKNGKSLVIYHHLGQGLKKGETAEDRIDFISNELQRQLNPAAIWCLRWRRKVPRAYFVIAQPNHHEAFLRNRIDSLEGSPWRTNQRRRYQNPPFSL